MKAIICTVTLVLMSIVTYGQKDKELVMNEDTGLIEAVYFYDNGQDKPKRNL